MVDELTRQIGLAQYLGLAQVKERLILALAGALTFSKPSVEFFMLPFIKNSVLSYQVKAQVVQSICSLYIATSAVCNLLRVILDPNIGRSKARSLVRAFDHATAHHLLYILEAYFEPKVDEDLREQDAPLEDAGVRQARTLLITRLADTLELKATNLELINILIYSSLPINTIAEVIQEAIERYPGLLIEFVDIERINASRGVKQRSPLLVFPGRPKTEPCKTLLLKMQLKYPHFNVDRLYTALIELFEKSY